MQIVDIDIWLQITQLKIASNPFAKGFRDCDPEDWWVVKVVKVVKVIKVDRVVKVVKVVKVVTVNTVVKLVNVVARPSSL